MSNNIHQLRRVMKSAHHLKKENPVILKGRKITSSQALKYAWWFESFRNKLHSGIYRFSYFKKDGGIREARGTLDPTIIPEEHQPKHLSGAQDVRPESYDTFVYYDIKAQGWRSFRLENFIGFVEQV